MALAVRTLSDATAADDFDSDSDGVEGGSGPRSPRTRELRLRGVPTPWSLRLLAMLFGRKW